MAVAALPDLQVLVLAKEPRAGHAKTRLSPVLGPYGAAEVARACLLDTLDVVRDLGPARRVVVLDGSTGACLPADVDVLEQGRGSLGDRLAAAFEDAWRTCELPLLLLGMDTPQVAVEQLSAAAAALHVPGTDAVLGLALDGGWWALGLHRPVAGLLAGVPMSAPTTGASQLDRLRSLGLVTTLLPVLRDVDDAEDLRVVAAAVPPGCRLRAVADQLLGVQA